MQDVRVQSRPHWRAILTFYLLAYAFSRPFFWWRDVNTKSWNASQIPPEIRDLTWGFLTERTGSLLLAVTVHEWVDIIADLSGDRALFWSGIACIAIWICLVWTWPKRQTEPARARLQTLVSSV
jgi:hypothetical protein